MTETTPSPVLYANAFIDEPIILAYIQGLRKRQGGKHQKRHAEIEGSVEQKYHGERARYAATEDRFRVHLQNLYREWLDGDKTQVEFYKAFRTDLYQYYAEMYLLGRRAVGRRDSRLTDEEHRQLHGLHSQEMKFFSRFCGVMRENGGKMPYPERLDQYALSGYRVYLRGALNTVPFADTARFPWVVHHEAEHCDLCIWKEEESKRRGGFTIKELDEEIGWPGEKGPGCPEDIHWCHRRCRCSLDLPSDYTKVPRTRPTRFGELDNIRLRNPDNGNPKTKSANTSSAVRSFRKRKKRA